MGNLIGGWLPWVMAKLVMPHEKKINTLTFMVTVEIL
jgi:hypothetical protein